MSVPLGTSYAYQVRHALAMHGELHSLEINMKQCKIVAPVYWRPSKSSDHVSFCLTARAVI